MPIITSVVNLAITDQYFVKRDWKLLYWVGVCYIFANAFGTWYTGHLIYPGPFSWENPLESFCVYWLQAPLLAAIHYALACWTQKVYKKPIHNAN